MARSSTAVWCACLVGLLMSGQASLDFVPLYARDFAQDCQAELWTQSTWEGGPGQELWGDTTMYYTDTGMDEESSPGDLMLRYPGWENTGELAGATAVSSITQALDGFLYAGTYPNARVFKSINAGTTWVNTGELAGPDYPVFAVLGASDGAVYAGIPDLTYWNGRVYKTTDGGTTWVETGDLPDAGDIYTLMEAQDGAIYASGDHHVPGPLFIGVVFKTTNGGLTWSETAYMDSSGHVHTVFQASNGTIYAGDEHRKAFWSTDGGTTWNWTGRVGGRQYEFIQDFQGALYSGGLDTIGNGVFKSLDAGTTWVKVAAFPEANQIEALLQASDGTIYAGAVGNYPSLAAVFRSTDAGTTWVQTGDLGEGAWGLHDLMQASDGTIYATTGGYGDVYRWCPPQGDLVSSVFDAGPSPEYGTMSWDETLNGQTLLMKVRTDTLQDMSTAPDWPSCPPVVNGDDISSLSSVDDGDPYVQYRVEMVSSSVDSTPVLHEVRIEYTPTGVEEQQEARSQKQEERLLHNWPNPFSRKTAISYQISTSGYVTLGVYDLSGKIVRNLADGRQSPGHHTIVWDGRDSYGRPVASGIYFYRLAVRHTDGRRPDPSGGQAAGLTSTKKLVVLR